MPDTKPDELLRAAGRRTREKIEARDRERFDPRWDDYCAGKLEEPQRAALLTETADSPESRLAATLFEPLGEDFKASVVEALRQETAAGRKQGTPELGTPELRGGGSRRRIWRRWLESFFGTGQVLNFRLAAVAAVLVALAGLYPWMRSAEGPMPVYELEVDGSRLNRSASGDAKLFKQAHRFTFKLTPRTNVSGQPEFRIYVREKGGRLERWQEAEETAEISPDGVALASDLLKWEWGPGRWTLYFAIGRSLPPEGELRRFLGLEPRPVPESWQLVEEEIDVEEIDGEP